MLLDLKTDVIYDSANTSNVRGIGLTSTVVKGSLASSSLLEKFGDIPVAVKLFKDDESGHDDYLFEVAIMSILPVCPFLVQLIGYSEAPKAIVMKHYQVTLKLLLKSPEIIKSIILRLKIGYDIAHGMNVIHNCGVLHLDLKPRKKVYYLLWFFQIT